MTCSLCTYAIEDVIRNAAMPLSGLSSRLLKLVRKATAVGLEHDDVVEMITLAESIQFSAQRLDVKLGRITGMGLNEFARRYYQ